MARLRLRLLAQQTVDVCEQHERIGFETAHDQRREAIVVAEDAERARFGATDSSSAVETVSFSLTMGSTPKPSSFSMVRCKIRVAAPVGEIFLGEQHLRDFHVPGGEKISCMRPSAGFGRRRRRPAWSPCRARRERCRPSQPRPRPTAPDETRTTWRPSFMSCAMERTIGSTRSAQSSPSRAGDGARADLDDDAARRLQALFALGFHLGSCHTHPRVIRRFSETAWVG